MAERIEFTADPTPAEPPAVEPVEGGDRPSWLPENFESPEAFAASYKELQAKLTSDSQGATSEEPAPIADPAVPEATVETLAAGGIDYNAIQDEFMETGVVSEARYTELAGLGFPKEIVDQHIADKQAAVAKTEADIKALVGGDNEFQTLVLWAGENYTPEQREAYNEAANSRDPVKMQNSVKALKSDYDRAKGVRPSFLTPTTAPVTGGDQYQSMAQFLTDQANPLYKTDPAFRAKVADKLGRSNNI